MCGARPKCDLVLERLPDGRTEPDDARIYFSCYVEKYIGRDRERVKGGIVVSGFLLSDFFILKWKEDAID